MSIIRAGWVLRFIDGISNDYVYVRDDKNGKEIVEDYGGITNNGLVEVISELIDDRYPEPYKSYLIKKLAEKLNVKLRDVFLSSEEACNETMLSFEPIKKVLEETDKEEIKKKW